MRQAKGVWRLCARAGTMRAPRACFAKDLWHRESAKQTQLSVHGGVHVHGGGRGRRPSPGPYGRACHGGCRPSVRPASSRNGRPGWGWSGEARKNALWAACSKKGCQWYLSTYRISTNRTDFSQIFARCARRQILDQICQNMCLGQCACRKEPAPT